MGRPSRHKEKHDKNGKLSQDDCNEGSAARTRPFSFDEIMVSRENKKLSDSVKEETLEAGKASGGKILEKDPDYYESERVYRHHHREYSHGVRRLSSEVYIKVSDKKEDNTSMKEGKVEKHRSRVSHVSETQPKFEAKREKVDKLKSEVSHASENQSKVEAKRDNVDKLKSKESHASETHAKDEKKRAVRIKDKDTTEVQMPRRKIDKHLSYEFKDEAEKKHSRGFIEKGRLTDGSSANVERENKRKYQNGDEKKSKDVKPAKKHDIIKGHGIEIPERKERRELPKNHHEDLRVKRRRSRSRDREVSRHRRSKSRSPRPHKHKSQHGREHGEPPSDALKLTSGRQQQQSDVGKSRIEGNVSNSHSRRHSGSASGLGGYSPRKRRAEAVTKTPSPPKRSPERRTGRWDTTPAIPGGIFSGSIASDFQQANKDASLNQNFVASDTMKHYAAISYHAISTNQNASFESVQLTQSTRPLRRLYVENVPATVSEKDMIDCFNKLLLSSSFNHTQGTERCISCIIHKEKSQAFVEFLSPDDASAALSFDGVSLAGSILNIKRPKDFVAVTTGELEKLEGSSDAISDIVKDSPHKIFIGGISKTLTSEMIMKIATAFGMLKAYHFEVNDDPNEQCAFVEYVDHSVTIKACSGLNGMKLGGQVITAVQAFPNATVLEINGKPPIYGIPEHAKALLNKPTPVLKLRNVFNPECLSPAYEQEMEELLEDIRLECARFGAIKSVNVVKHVISQITNSEPCKVSETKDAGTVSEDVEMNNVDILSNTNEDTKIDKSVEGEGNNLTGSPAISHLEDGVCQPGNEMTMIDPVDNEVPEPCTNKVVEDKADERTSEAITKELPDPPNIIKVEPDSLDEKDSVLTDDVSVGNKTVEKELNCEDIDASDDGERKGDGEKQEKQNLEVIFEPGCVFVEYRRTEASCVAAGCLHGRLFDNQVVTVEYIPLEVYRARFPK